MTRRSPEGASARRAGAVRVVLFCHSLLSDWSHGSAHFLRGVMTELALRGHDVRVYEPRDAWSVQCLVREHGEDALAVLDRVYPELRPQRYDLATLDLDEALDGADVVIVHAWNHPDLVRWLGARRCAGASFRLFFHDTYHRSVTDPRSVARYDLSGFDGVLAFGAAVKDVYERHGWTRRAWVWHEAADVRLFRPAAREVPKRGDVVYVGNYAERDRGAALRDLVFEPVRELGLRAKVHGVRYPEPVLAEMAKLGIEHGGWIPNHRVPDVLAEHTITIHVPRRPYVSKLRGVPTIGLFEALACGAPLVSGAWDDVEGLFTPGEDFLVARSGAEMQAALTTLLRDRDARDALSRRGRQTVLLHHTCAHRVDELFAIVRTVRGRVPTPPSSSQQPVSHARVREVDHLSHARASGGCS